MDAYRMLQKGECPNSYSKLRKRNRYGCECCMKMSLPKLKVHSRKVARTRLKRQKEEY